MRMAVLASCMPRARNKTCLACWGRARAVASGKHDWLATELARVNGLAAAPLEHY
jgi:hypothetical protein